MSKAKRTTYEWQDLITLTQGQPILIEKVKLVEKGIRIEGQFELPQLAKLAIEDQVFVTAFVRCHGSIKEMEQTFGVSYPTVKARLNRIGDSLEFVEVNPRALKSEVLDRLQKGEITAAQAIQELEAK